MSHSPKNTQGRDFPSGGEMGKLIREHNWSATPLGPVETWPQSLRSAVSILLPSKAQIVLFWGPDLITIYNDAYAPTFGAKHPWALGRSARDCWSEVWHVIGPLFEGVVRTGEAFWAKDHPFFLRRQGFLEETFFDVSYDPVRIEGGGVGGIFCIVSDQTGRVLGERRLRTLRELGTRTADAKNAEEVFREAAAALAMNPADIPFSLLYLFDGPGQAVRSMADHVGRSPKHLPGLNSKIEPRRPSKGPRPAGVSKARDPVTTLLHRALPRRQESGRRARSVSRRSGLAHSSLIFAGFIAPRLLLYSPG